MLLLRAVLGRAASWVSVWRGAFRHVRFCLSAYYDRGRVRCCQGGDFREYVVGCRGGIPAYAGMTGVGDGNDGTGVWDMTWRKVWK